jgi:hypothetical protein
MLDRPDERIINNKANPIPVQRLNQTYEPHRPVMMLNHYPQHYEDPIRGPPHKPSIFDKTISSTNYPHKNT